MKKLFLMVVMLFTVGTYSYAENNNTTEAARLAKYDVKVNTKKLANYLDLTEDQIEAVDIISKELTNDLKFAAVECNNENRAHVTNNLITKNVNNMRYILTPEQMRKYLRVLNLTMVNRGIK